MNKLSKICILSIILVLFSISYASASDINVDDIQIAGDGGNVPEISIDEFSSDNGLGSEAPSDSIQASDEEYCSKENGQLAAGGNGFDDLRDNKKQKSSILAAASSNTHTVSSNDYSKYFDTKGYVNTKLVKSGDVIDLSGNFNKRNFTFTIPCSITSSLKNAVLTNCVVKYENVSSSIYSNVSNLRFTASLEKHPCVYIVSSNHVNVFNCNAYSTGANSNPALLVGSSYCNIHDNIFETTFTGYMNMSWKRAGILLGESHYNNIYSNDVTVKDSNGIYLTTYGWEKSNYNNIYNNTVRSSAISEETGLPNPSAWAYGIHLMGDYNIASNNTVYLMYRGVDSEGSFNQIIGNDIYSLAGSYYEGNNGTDGGEYGIHASYSNIIANNTIHDSKITGSGIYVSLNCTAYGNTVRNVSGDHGFEFSTTASNVLIENNLINMSSGNGIYIRGNMSNVTLSNNRIDANNGTGILVKMLSKSKIPDNITIKDNQFNGFKEVAIIFSDVENKSNLTIFNNSIVVSNETFFNAFDSQGFLKNQKGIDYIFLKGIFSALPIDSIKINQEISILGEDCRIINIPIILNSSNINVENISLSMDNGEDSFLLNDARNISFINNSVIVDSENYAMVLNNSQISMLDNFIQINAYNSAILNDNGSHILYGENIIKTLAEEDIQSLHGSTLKITVYILSDDNYGSLFDSKGKFLDDSTISIGDTLKIANLTNKTIRIDIPLKISSYKDSQIINSTIILEDMASSTNITNLMFKLENSDFNRDFSFIKIKDGVSDILIRNNQFHLANTYGDYSFSAICIIGADLSSKDISLLDNAFDLNASLKSLSAISALNEGIANYNDIIDRLSISKNNISLVNGDEDGLAYAISLINGRNIDLLSNDISVKGNVAYGIYLDKVLGFNEKDNIVFENNALSSIIHSNNPTKDIQNAIDSSNNWDKIYLGNNSYSIKESLVIDKSISLIGGTLLDEIDSRLRLLSNDDPLFAVLPNSNGNAVNLLDMTVILDDGDLFILSLLKNSTKPIEIDYSLVNIINGTFLKANGNVDGSSISLAKCICQRPFLKSIDCVLVKDNRFIEGMNQIKYYLCNDSEGNEINLDGGIKTLIISNNASYTALDKNIYGNSIKYFEIRILDENRNPLANKKIHISYNNSIYELLSDAKGVVKLPVNVNAYGIHSILISFLGDKNYRAAFSEAKISINKQKAILSAPNKVYLITANKYLTATFKDINGKFIQNKKISFILNGKTYNAYTNSKGGAKIKIKLDVAKTYYVTVKYAGDNAYSPISKSLKIQVKKIGTKLIVKNRSYRKKNKVKKLTATLKTKSGKAIAKKKLVFIVNGKKYSAKTNKKGVATVKVKISKRKTYKFTVKFAGDGSYLKVNKKAKIKII